MNNKRTSALCPLPSALCPLPDRQIVDANMLMLNAPCSMLNVQFFLTYAHTHTHMHFKKAPPSNRSFPRGPCGRCKGEDEVEAEAGEKEHRRRETGRSRFEGPRRRTLKTAIPALSMAASQRRGSRPEREREAAAGLPRNLSVGSEERMAQMQRSLPLAWHLACLPAAGGAPRQEGIEVST